MRYDPNSTKPYFCVGLDLGKQTDFSALAALRWTPPRPPLWALPMYDLPMLRRWALGTPYLDIVASVARFFKQPPISESDRVALVIDATGVGDAVYEMVRAEMARAEVRGGICAVTITAGSAVSKAGNARWHVAKKQLVSVLQVLLGKRRLRIADDLPESQTLKKELGTFSVKITDSANETFESWRERDHDDEVLAVALAAWAAEYLDYFRPWQQEPAGHAVQTRR